MIATPFQSITTRLTVSEELGEVRSKFFAGFRSFVVFLGLLVGVPFCLAVLVGSLPDNHFLFEADGRAITSLEASGAFHVTEGERLVIEGPHSVRWWCRDPSLEVSSSNHEK